MQEFRFTKNMDLGDFTKGFVPPFWEKSLRWEFILELIRLLCDKSTNNVKILQVRLFHFSQVD